MEVALHGGLALGGRYRLERLLGRGAMGQVWLGTDLRLGRAIAVKILPTLREPDTDRTSRFQNEAKIAAALQHPGITVVHDVGEHDDLLFFVMEYLEGEDLGRVLRRRSEGLPIDQTLSVAAQLAAALAAAHRQGVAHRDIKPANIMVMPDGRTKVCDFGVARIVRDGGSSATAGVGTAAYMAPEQFRGRVSEHSDLYSLGCVLFEMVTGSRPFLGSTEQLMYSHLEAQPPQVESLRPDTPQALVDLIQELLAKEPAQRPENGRRVFERLRGIRNELRQATAAVRVLRPHGGASPAPASEVTPVAAAVPSSRASEQERGRPVESSGAYALPPLSVLERERSAGLGAIMNTEVDGTRTHPLSVVTGTVPDGGAFTLDIASLPHLIIGGSPGLDMFCGVHTIITALLMGSTPHEVQMVLADSERAELSPYAGVPHLLSPVVIEPAKAVAMLRWAEEEMERRYDDLAASGLRHIDDYNKAVIDGVLPGPLQRLGTADPPHPYVVVIISELAELMAVAPAETESSVCHLARLGRASGIHLVLSTRRPTEKTLKRRLRAEIPCRLALRTTSAADSELVIDEAGAEALAGSGAGLFLPKGAVHPLAVHCATVSEKEIEAVVEHWLRQA